MASFLFGTKSLTKRLITYILSISVYIQAFSFCTIYLTLFFSGFQFIVDYINLIIYARNTCMEHTILIETCQIKFLHLFPTTRCTCYRPSGVTTVTEVYIRRYPLSPPRGRVLGCGEQGECDRLSVPLWIHGGQIQVFGKNNWTQWPKDTIRITGLSENPLATGGFPTQTGQ